MAKQSSSLGGLFSKWHLFPSAYLESHILKGKHYKSNDIADQYLTL